MAYVEGTLDWMCETCLDITRELYRLMVTVGTNRFSYKPSVRLDPTPGSLIPRCLNLFIGHSKHTVHTAWRLCAPEFNLVEARMRAPKQTRLGSVHLPGDARRTHVRRSRHLPLYDPKVKGLQDTRV
ncbi:hypothetical protein CRG98_012359 [Punica granatum]|uniref:Uncharacterized protein n=1 Tax=Punica granatum TaxID=22663 RepID=A0A2I0KGD6_PUNGR|nr:hypothetical protein CRG98_012359 [Punica granatum]